eukprot:Opistho-2@75148
MSDRDDDPAVGDAAGWRSLALELREELQESKDALEEFQESSRELEAELESQLNQSEAKVKELKQSAERAARESESLREKLQALQSESNRTVAECGRLRTENENLLSRVRSLEQANDDLERAERVAVASASDSESRTLAALERLALMEAQNEEHEATHIELQRLKDELRDLRMELELRPAIGFAATVNERPIDMHAEAIAPSTPTRTKDAAPPTATPSPSGPRNILSALNSILARMTKFEQRISTAKETTGAAADGGESSARRLSMPPS